MSCILLHASVTLSAESPSMTATYDSPKLVKTMVTLWIFINVSEIPRHESPIQIMEGKEQTEKHL